MSNATVARQIYMSGARVQQGDVDFSGIVTGGSIWLEAETRIEGSLNLERAHIGDSLMMGQGTFHQVVLTAARIDHELRLENGGKPTLWIPPPPILSDPSKNEMDPTKGDPNNWLVLRNAHIDVIRDTPRAWPDCLTLTGLVYTRPPADASERSSENDAQLPPASAFHWCKKLKNPLPPVTRYDWAGPRLLRWYLIPCPNWVLGVSWLSCKPVPEEDDVYENRMSTSRSNKWWLNWLERDPERTTLAYTQLANALDVIGERGHADTIRFKMRIYEMQHEDLSSPLLYFLYGERVFVGFGIGAYALFALFWTVVFVAIATYFLRRRLRELNAMTGLPYDQIKTLRAALSDKGKMWCTLASLQTLLPLVTLSKQMDDFLHTPVVKELPKTQPLHGRYAYGFALLAVAGLVLSGFLLQGLRSYAGL